MPVKDDWANGQTVNASDLNEVAVAVNALEEAGSVSSWDDLEDKPAVIAAGADQAAARTAIGAVAQADIDTAVTNLKGTAGAALDTLGELSDALNDDANYAATVTTALGTKARKSGNVYHVSDHGLVGDWTGGDANAGSGTNDTAALNTLITAAPAGSTILFDGSKTYRLDPLTTITKALTFDFNGASVVTKTMSSGDLTTGAPFLRFSSAVGTARAFGAISLWATSVTTTTAAHAGDFAAGDYVLVADNFELLKWDTGAHAGAGRGEINIVESANSGTGAVALEYPVSANYSSTYNSTTPTITKISSPIVGATVKNISQIIDTNPGGDYVGTYAAMSTRPNIIEFDYCVDPLVENVRVNGFQLQAVHFARCIRARAVRVDARNPFSVNGGHGYLVGIFQCVDSEALGCVSYSCRHTVDYESGTRNGSRQCKTYNTRGRAYGPHGHESRDLYSVDDWVIGGDTNTYGWGNGNNSFGADHGYLIVRPNQYGGHRAIAGTAGSDGLRVVSPNIHTPSHCIKLEYALDTVIDLRGGGVLHNTDTVTTSGRTIWAETGIGDTTKDTGDVTIYGTDEGFQGTYRAIKVTLQAASTVKLINVPTAVPVEVVSGLTSYATLNQPTITEGKFDNLHESTFGTIALQLGGVSGAVNRLNIGSQAAGSAPLINAVGSDTNISVDIRGKGTGKIRIQDPATTSKRAQLDVTGVTGTRNFAFPDAAGTFVLNDNTATLSGKTLTNPTITNYTESVVAIGNTGTAKTIDLTSGTVQTATLTGNCTFTMPTAAAGKSFTLLLNTGAGSFTGTFTSVKWPAGTAPTVTTTASRLDIFTFTSDGTNWYGSSAQNYTP